MEFLLSTKLGLAELVENLSRKWIIWNIRCWFWPLELGKSTQLEKTSVFIFVLAYVLNRVKTHN